MRLDRATLIALADLLATPDGPELAGRGHRVTQAGRADRRSAVLLPLLVRWAVTRHVDREAPFIAPAKPQRLRMVNRRRA